MLSDIRLLRRGIVIVRRQHTCQTCNRPICKGEQAVKTEWAERIGSSSRETIRAEYDCCTVRGRAIRPVRWWTGHNVWKGYRGITAESFRVA